MTTRRTRNGGLFNDSSAFPVAWHSFAPEVRLVCAVIQQACNEAMNGNTSARAFIASTDFNHWCELINLSPAYVREKLAENGTGRRSRLRRRIKI